MVPLREHTAAAATVLVLATLTLGLTGASAARGAASTDTPVTVAVDLGRQGHRIPSDFLGLSMEVKNLPQVAQFANRGDLVALMRSLGQGVLRLGGVSADKFSAWTGTGTKLPSWASTAVTVGDLRGIAALARATGWRVLLTVNLGHFDPASASQEARAAKAALGSRLTAIEIGNEPDSYVVKGLRAQPWMFATYKPQALAYRARIEQVDPGLALAGPDVSTGVPMLRWVRAAAASTHPALLTAHYYPLSRCGGYPPKLSDLLGSGGLRSMETQYLGDMVAIARGARIPVRVDETNNVSCGGQAGVSDTYAAALWALDYLMRAMDSGVTGVNFHDLIDNYRSYGPLAAPSRSALAAGRLTPQPEWYALLIARRLLGDRLVATSVTPSYPDLTAQAFLSTQGHLQIVLVNFDSPGTTPLRVALGVPRRYAGGTVLRLTAPGPSATTGVELGGRAVGADGSFRPRLPLARLTPGAGGPAVTLAPDSAALVSLSTSAGPSNLPPSARSLLSSLERLARTVRHEVGLAAAELTSRRPRSVTGSGTRSVTGSRTRPVTRRRTR